ncbi:hypothetical protein GTA08_BOTSDO07409 [Neofusicoccum parvum]|nr:hypothetical protein GTA08_BOTSDO07409 [Neofusicoccum parvum]
MASTDFIIVGAGYAGLTTAIELTRKGFNVEVFESAKKFTDQGDIIMMNPSISRVLSKWGGCLQELEAVSAPGTRMAIFDWKGNQIVEDPMGYSPDGYSFLVAPRGPLHLIMYRYALSIGIKIHFSTPISKVFEEEDCAGVYVGDERIKAAGVIAADGVHSKVRRQILDDEGQTKPSGFAIYRSFFDMSRLLDDPRTRHFAEGKGDGIYLWIGTDVHAVVLPNKNLGKIGCFLTHRDEFDVVESWSTKGDRSHLLKVIDGWDDTLHALFSKIPSEELFDWKLLWRDPLKSWVSPKGRILLVGDSSHPHLPTSGSGAMQAIEDGATFGALADTLGMDNIPDLFKVFQALRYERTNLTQRLGWENRYRLHHTDWEAVKKDPSLAKPTLPEWGVVHDAEKYAYENAQAALKGLKSGIKFKSTNVPEDYVYQEWNVQTLMDLEA